MFDIDDAIPRHQRLIDKHGEVWFGKMGKTLGRPHVANINAQCAQGIPTYTYLVERTKSGYQVYRGRIVQVSREHPEDAEKIPGYYSSAGIMRYIKLWIRLSDMRLVNSEVLGRLRIATSGFTVADTLQASMAAMFITNCSGD